MARVQGMSPKRLFVGTFLAHDQQVNLSKLTNWKEPLERNWQAKVRFVKSIKLHLTWLFLGDVDSAKIGEVERLLSETVNNHTAMSVSYDQIELWPSAKRRRLLVLAPRVVADQITRLYESVVNKLENFAEKPKAGPYRPHITLARLKVNHSDKSTRIIPDDLLLDTPVIQDIDQICLIESQLGHGADEYKILFGKQLPQ